MSNKDKNLRNDKIRQKVETLGYCCVLHFMTEHSIQRSDGTYRIPTKKLAVMLGLGESTIEFNRRKLRTGGFQCENAQNCQRACNQTGEQSDE